MLIGEGFSLKMNLNTKYCETMIRQGKATVTKSEIKDGFIINHLKYRDSYGIVRYGTYREKLEKENGNLSIKSTR
jgi:hypothetical protein